MAASGVEARPIDKQCPSTPIDEQCWWLCGCHAAPHRCRAVSAVFATAAPTALTAPTVCDGHCCNPLPAANTSMSAASIDEHWHWQRPEQHARRTLPPWRRAQSATRKRISPVCGLLPKRTPPIGQRPAIDIHVNGDVGASRPPEKVRAALVSAPGVAGSLMKGMYYFLHHLYTHEAGKRARGAIQVRGPRFGRRKSARLLRSRNPSGLSFYTTGRSLQTTSVNECPHVHACAPAPV